MSHGTKAKGPPFDGLSAAQAYHLLALDGCFISECIFVSLVYAVKSILNPPSPPNARSHTGDHSELLCHPLRPETIRLFNSLW